MHIAEDCICIAEQSCTVKNTATSPWQETLRYGEKLVGTLRGQIDRFEA